MTLRFVALALAAALAALSCGAIPARALDASKFRSEFGLSLTEVGAVESGQPTVRLFDGGASVPAPSGYLHFRESAE